MLVAILRLGPEIGRGGHHLVQRYLARSMTTACVGGFVSQGIECNASAFATEEGLDRETPNLVAFARRVLAQAPYVRASMRLSIIHDKMSSTHSAAHINRATSLRARQQRLPNKLVELHPREARRNRSGLLL